MPVSNFSSLSRCWNSILLMLLLTFLQCCFYCFYHKIIIWLGRYFVYFLCHTTACPVILLFAVVAFLSICKTLSWFVNFFVHKIYIPSHPWSQLIPSYFLSSLKLRIESGWIISLFLMFPWVTTPDTVKPVYSDHLGDKVSAVVIDKWSLWRRPVYNGQNC